MKLRKLREDEVHFRLHVEEESVQVRGNAQYTGDAQDKKEAEDQILARLAYGDTWAWAQVEVTASWGVFSAHDRLGSCTYANSEDFMSSDDYTSLREGALAALQKEVEKTFNMLQLLVCPD